MSAKYGPTTTQLNTGYSASSVTGGCRTAFSLYGKSPSDTDSGAADDVGLSLFRFEGAAKCPPGDADPACAGAGLSPRARPNTRS
jgi:hypothetical protein